MTPTKTVYYESYDDDFAGTNIDTQRIEADFPYIHKNPVWNVTAFILYHVIARPIVWLAAKLWLGVRIEGRENIRELKGPYFLYGNHTNILDVFIPNIITRSRKAYIIAGADTVSIPGLRHIVQMLGAIPIPSTLRGTVAFKNTIKHRYADGGCIVIYPEAHIWPYCSFIRPFPATSFIYPAELNAPVVAITVTYRKRKGIFSLLKRPGMTVRISKPVYPEPGLYRKEQAEYLRDTVYGIMNSAVSDPAGVEYVKYVKKSTE